jgi:hypothetical protein
MRATQADFLKRCGQEWETSLRAESLDSKKSSETVEAANQAMPSARIASQSALDGRAMVPQIKSPTGKATLKFLSG